MVSVTKKPSSSLIIGLVSKSSSESLAVTSPLSTSILDLLSEVSLEVASRAGAEEGGGITGRSPTSLVGAGLAEVEAVAASRSLEMPLLVEGKSPVGASFDFCGCTKIYRVRLFLDGEGGQKTFIRFNEKRSLYNMNISVQ